MKTILVNLLALFILGFHLPASADREYRAHNKVGGAACFTREAYDEYTEAAIHARKTRDVSRMKFLYATKRCVRMPRRARIIIIDYGWWSGVSKVYLHPQGGTRVVVWTANENFR